MSRKKKKRPLPPRTLRMDRKGRLQSAPHWLPTQRGRTPEQIARSYRKRYGVDWPCAIAELSALGIVFDAQWREQITRTLDNAQRASAARKQAEPKAGPARGDSRDSDETFQYIAGYTEGGAPYGVTWDEWKQMEHEPPGECQSTLEDEPGLDHYPSLAAQPPAPQDEPDDSVPF